MAPDADYDSDFKKEPSPPSETEKEQSERLLMEKIASLQSLLSQTRKENKKLRTNATPKDSTTPNTTQTQHHNPKPRNRNDDSDDEAGDERETVKTKKPKNIRQDKEPGDIGTKNHGKFLSLFFSDQDRMSIYSD